MKGARHATARTVSLSARQALFTHTHTYTHSLTHTHITVEWALHSAALVTTSEFPPHSLCH